jgi:hypothetical protein
MKKPKYKDRYILATGYPWKSWGKLLMTPTSTSGAEINLKVPDIFLLEMSKDKMGNGVPRYHLVLEKVRRKK